MDSYTDEKGRLRWRINEEIGEKLKELHDLLVIGGYPPDHAARYPKLAYEISRYPEPITELHVAGRLRELSGVAKTVEGILIELIETGDCAKARKVSEGYEPPPRSVLELTAIPGLGAKTVRALYAEQGISSLEGCARALQESTLPGIGPKMREKILFEWARRDSNPLPAD